MEDHLNPNRKHFIPMNPKNLWAIGPNKLKFRAVRSNYNVIILLKLIIKLPMELIFFTAYFYTGMIRKGNTFSKQPPRLNLSIHM
jgi:hypothetical protein